MPPSPFAPMVANRLALLPSADGVKVEVTPWPSR